MPLCPPCPQPRLTNRAPPRAPSSPRCGHCQRLKGPYLQAATANKGIVHYAAINCDEHNGLCGEYGVKGFPTLKIFGANKKKPSEYQGERTAKGVSQALLELLPPVTQVTADNHAKFLAAAPGLPKALLFTEKPATAPMLKALALEFKGRLLIGEVRPGKGGPLFDTYKVTFFPRLLVLPAREEGAPEGAAGDAEPEPYEGDIKVDKLRAFLEEVRTGSHVGSSGGCKGRGERMLRKGLAWPSLVETATRLLS